MNKADPLARFAMAAVLTMPVALGLPGTARAADECQALTIPPPVMSSKTANIKDFPMYQARKPGAKMTFALLLFSRGFEWMIGLGERLRRGVQEAWSDPDRA